jgi:hypothetical protein
MIEFQQKDSKVIVRINTGVAVEKNTLVMEWDAGNDLCARLLLDRLNMKFAEDTRSIREDAYNKGWDDKQKRKIKKTWFRSFFGKINW